MLHYNFVNMTFLAEWLEAQGRGEVARPAVVLWNDISQACQPGHQEQI